MSDPLEGIFKRLGRVEQILATLYNPEIKNGIIPRIESSLTNHLAHHNKASKSWGDRIFKISMIVLYAILVAMITGYKIFR